MRRTLLAALAAGAALSILPATGTWSNFSDTAISGEVSAQTGDLATPVVIEMASRADNACADDWGGADVGSTGLVIDSPAVAQSITEVLCIRNRGDALANVTLSVRDLVDDDFACSESEGGVDDSCGDNQAGELSRHLAVQAALREDCAATDMPESAGVVELTTSPTTLGQLEADATSCVVLVLHYTPGETDDVQQAVQTDKATWRWGATGEEVIVVDFPPPGGGGID